MWSSGLSEHPLALWCLSQLRGRDWLGSQDRVHRGGGGRGRHSRYGAWTGADGDGEQRPADLSGDRWPSRWPGREAGQSWQPETAATFSLFLLNLSQKAPVFPLPGCAQLHRGCGAGGRVGATGLSSTPSPSPGHDKTLLTQETKLRDMKQPQKKIYFQFYFLYFFSFQPFWDLAQLLWDRRIREKHESSHKVFVL